MGHMLRILLILAVATTVYAWPKPIVPTAPVATYPALDRYLQETYNQEVETYHIDMERYNERQEREEERDRQMDDLHNNPYDIKDIYDD